VQLAAATAEEAAKGAVVTEAQEQAPAEAVAVEAQEEAPAEAGLVDIASILGTPTVTVVRSSL
jgi:predicted secreted protein